VIRYVVSIHDDVLCDILKSLIRAGMADTSIVSAYITIVVIELRTATTFHAEVGIFFADDGISDRNVNIIILFLFYIYTEIVWMYLVFHK
jgi:hypothetical protein